MKLKVTTDVMIYMEIHYKMMAYSEVLLHNDYEETKLFVW